MRKTILLAVAMAAACQVRAFAQTSLGYGFLGGAFGDSPVGGAFRYGIGGEAKIFPDVTLGAEIGGIARNGSGVLGSGNLNVYVPIHPQTIAPFFTGGFSAGRKSGATGLWADLGGGVNYWLQHNIGARVEFRGYPGGYHLGSFAEFRFGVVFR